MLKVYGVTFDHTTNYGSLFQAYALKTAIEQEKGVGGCEYSLIPIRQMPDYTGKTSAADAAYMAAYRLLHRSRFTRLEKKHLRFAKCSSLKELDALNDSADAFVCGSDVIWNPEFNKGCGAYYLDFAKKYKFSYAASFGKANAEAITPQIGQWLKQLDAISCREQRASGIAAKVTGNMPLVVADPIFLLERSRWEKICAEDKGILPGHYIFAYNTYPDAAYEAVLTQLGSQTGLPIIRSTWKLKNALSQRMITIQPPARWLRLLANADYVVTNSFHGTGFAVLFRRNFYSIAPGTAEQGANVRIWDFLTRLGLDQRIVSGASQTIPAGELDYSEADERLEAFRKESADYLRQNLEAAMRRKKAGGESPDRQRS